jgi:hypothetical protein
MKDDQMEEDMREDAMNNAINKTVRLERELVSAKQKAEENENMAAWTQKFISTGQARVNEHG